MGNKKISDINKFKVIPHKDYAEDAQSDFSTYCIEIPQAYVEEVLCKMTENIQADSVQN